MKSNRRNIAALTAVLVGSALAILPAGSAFAYTECNTGWVCFYTASDFNPASPHLDRFGDEFNWPSFITNQDESVHNHGTTGASVRVYTLDYFINQVYCVKMGSKVVLPSNWDNQGNSHEWLTGISGCL